MAYKKGSKQQYIVKRKQIKAAVKEKLKKPRSSRPKQTVLKAPKTAPEAPPAPVAEEENVKLPPGFKAKLRYNSGSTTVTADIRYETEKTSPLIKVKNIGPKGEVVHREFVGPKKVETWFDEKGNEVSKADVRTAQVMPDGSLVPVIIKKTKDIIVEPVDAEVANDFLPYSFLEVWGESDPDVDGLRKISADLMKSGKVGAIKEFSHGYGKMYVGFMKPIISKDGSRFGVEIMLAENRRGRRRWMLAEPSRQKAQKAKAPSIPQLW